MDCNYGTQLFRKREDWVDHLGLQHGLYPEWKSFTCPICHEDTGDGELIITRHLSSHMEEISLASLPAGVEIDDESNSGASDTSQTRREKVECRVCGRPDFSDEMELCFHPPAPAHWFHIWCRQTANTRQPVVAHFCGVCGDEKAEELRVDTVSSSNKSPKSKLWGAYKATIMKLYKTENMTLQQVKESMSKEYKFEAG